MREGSAVYGENWEEDEDVSMPRRNKIEIFVDENRMSPRWKKGRIRKRKREGWRNVLRVRQRERKTKRKGIAPERRSKCRIEVRSEMPIAEGQRRRSIVFPFFLFFSPTVAKG